MLSPRAGARRSTIPISRPGSVGQLCHRKSSPRRRNSRRPLRLPRSRPSRLRPLERRRRPACPPQLCDHRRSRSRRSPRPECHHHCRPHHGALMRLEWVAPPRRAPRRKRSRSRVPPRCCPLVRATGCLRRQCRRFILRTCRGRLARRPRGICRHFHSMRSTLMTTALFGRRRAAWRRRRAQVIQQGSMTQLLSQSRTVRCGGCSPISEPIPKIPSSP